VKQKITLEQLNELTQDQYLKLKEIWKTKDYSSNSTRYAVEGILPTFNIGQMIELLNEKDMDIEMELGGLEWFVCWNGYVCRQSPELCDSLWEIIKEIL